MKNNKIYNNSITENDEVIRLSNNTYATEKELRADFDDDSYNRLAINMNAYDDSQELYKHWNDTEWLHEHADIDINKRKTDGPDDKTIGFTHANMPSPSQWSDETGLDVKYYPAKSLNETIIDYYKRGAAQLQEESETDNDDLSQLAIGLYKYDDGSFEAKQAHRIANMLEWCEQGIKALTVYNPDIIWEHVDDDGIDNIITNITTDNVNYERIRNIAFNVVSSNLAHDTTYLNNDNYKYYTITDFNNSMMIVNHDKVMLIRMIETADNIGTCINYSAWSTDSYDVNVNRTGAVLKLTDTHNNTYVLYPLKDNASIHGLVFSNGSDDANHVNMMRTLANNIDKALMI